MNFLGIIAEKHWDSTDQVEDPWKKLFNSGKDARAKKAPFDTEQAEPWKRGWIAADIQLGVLEEQEQ